MIFNVFFHKKKLPKNNFFAVFQKKQPSHTSAKRKYVKSTIGGKQNNLIVYGQIMNRYKDCYADKKMKKMIF